MPAFTRIVPPFATVPVAEAVHMVIAAFGPVSRMRCGVSCSVAGFLYSGPFTLAGRAGSTRSALMPWVIISHRDPYRMPLYENVLSHARTFPAQVDTSPIAFTQLVPTTAERSRNESMGLA